MAGVFGRQVFFSFKKDITERAIDEAGKVVEKFMKGESYREHVCAFKVFYLWNIWIKHHGLLMCVYVCLCVFMCV